MSPSISITSDQEFFQRQIEEFNADEQLRWRLQQRKARRRRRYPDADAARLSLLDALDEWREQRRVRWFGPARWISKRSGRS